MNKKLLSLIFIFIFTTNCKKEEAKSNEIISDTEKINHEDIKTITPHEAHSFYKNTEKKYEYRTGKFNKYEYNYDVVGFDENKNPVTGNIITQGKLGAGVLSSSTNQNIEVEVEWVSNGKLIATDNENKEYDLKVKD